MAANFPSLIATDRHSVSVLPCRLLSMLSALCGVVAASIAVELRSGSDVAASLQPTQQQQQAQLQAEEAEEAQQRQRRSARGMAHEEPPPGPPPPFLGPISGRLARTLLSQLLVALQIGTALVCSDPRQQQNSQQAAGDSAGRTAAGLAQARATVEQDEELQLELRRNLEAAAAEAAVLVELYPPFAAMCAQHPWVAAELAPAGGGRRSESPALARFATAVDASLRG